ncbi:MAG TPA: SLBB domain-containing protein [Gemmatimonadaceae bacterium]|nr:SLBB domain-containing protein [Gemmatimonadaceae bacterium]
MSTSIACLTSGAGPVRAARTLALVAAVAVTAAVARPVAAQGDSTRAATVAARADASGDSSGGSRLHATRAMLERLAADAERGATDQRLDGDERAARAAEAAALRARLRDGDFRAGDRIVVVVRGDSALRDTFTVRAGQVLSLPGAGDLPLSGVLRAELQDHVRTAIGRYIRNPVVQTTALLRVAVLGEVGQPGYYSLPADALISDAIMVAGGPTQRADLDRTRVRRGRDEFLRQKQTKAALSEGRTLDQLGLRAGDEIFVGPRRERNWTQIVQISMWVIGFAAGVYGGTRVF